jgi:hypothetical protein
VNGPLWVDSGINKICPLLTVVADPNFTLLNLMFRHASTASIRRNYYRFCDKSYQRYYASSGFLFIVVEPSLAGYVYDAKIWANKFESRTYQKKICEEGSSGRYSFFKIDQSVFSSHKTFRRSSSFPSLRDRFGHSSSEHNIRWSGLCLHSMTIFHNSMRNRSSIPSVRNKKSCNC